MQLEEVQSMGVLPQGPLSEADEVSDNEERRAIWLSKPGSRGPQESDTTIRRRIVKKNREG